jgi:hypothetical protein
MIIEITDSSKSLTVIGCGALPRGSAKTIVTAGQIQAWIEVNSVISGSGRKINQPPFGVGGGDCEFDLFFLLRFFAGAKNAAADNVLMILVGFPVKPTSNDSGAGVLLSPPAAGVLIKKGSILWSIS